MNRKPFVITSFNDLYDTSTDHCLYVPTWKQFVHVFEGLYQIERKSKKTATLISSAEYEAGTTRSNSNVLHWGGWLAIDIDHNLQRETFKESLIKMAGEYTHICHSTASSSEKKPKCRIIFPLTDYVKRENIPKLWYAVNTMMGKIVDGQTKDLSRMFYIPGTYKDAFNFFWVHEGEKTLSEVEITRKYPVIETEESLLNKIDSKFLSEKYESWKRSTLTNTNVTYTTWRDCPFVNHKLVEEYREIVVFDSPGRYRKLYVLMVSIANKAIEMKYPLNVFELENLVKSIDSDVGSGYYLTTKPRKMTVECQRALDYAFKHKR